MNDGLMSWGRFPQAPQEAHAIAWRNDIASEMSKCVNANGSTLAYGQGRSYGDSCLAASNHVLHTKFLNRFISFDCKSGVITAESGVTLEQILTVILPRGWFFPVTPGTKYVSLGGAIANDVHGKNHHVRGTFGQHIICFSLVRSDGEIVECSKQKNKELYAATIGGLGLTGIIKTVELQLIPIVSSQIDVKTIRFNSLKDFFELSDELDKNHEYSVAWIDCLAKGDKAGRGVFMVGNHAESGELIVAAKGKIAVPFVFPISAINKVTLPMLNSLYYSVHKDKVQRSAQEYDSYFYPLDGINHWNRAYGKSGFQQYQCVIPEDCAQSVMHEILDIIAKSGSGSFLAVMKRCGAMVSPGIVSFPMPGLSLALDFPQEQLSEKNLFPQLDAIVRSASGRLYPAKDAHMSGEDFRHFYPKWEILEKYRDPALCSQFWKRVTNT